MKKKSRFIITKDDYQLLFELWRWKFLTTNMIHELAYKPRSVSACYQRLNNLENNGYIEGFSSQDAKMRFWQLTSKGFSCLYFEGEIFAQKGFRSEHINHDFWVNVFHISLAKNFCDMDKSIFTEQELRRYEVESYPDWVPHTKRHRPDGWCVQKSATTGAVSLLSIEVEFNRKPKETYADLGLFYTENVNVETVLWLVKSTVEAKYILNSLGQKTDNVNQIHSFITIDQFIKDQWQSPIVVGKNAGQPARSLFQKSAINGQEIFIADLFYDLRKYPTKSSINSFQQTHVIKIT